MENGVILLSSETTDIDCFKVDYNQTAETLDLTFIQSFKDTPFFFFTHG
jgi:hypothetical protein